MQSHKQGLAVSLGAEIKRLRKQTNMTQGAFGRKVLGRPKEDDRACQSWISRIELGNFSNHINEAVIIKIADTLGVKPEKLLNMWADYVNSIEETEGQASIPENINRAFPKLQTYFDSFFMMATLDDRTGMVNVLNRIIDYVKPESSDID